MTDAKTDRQTDRQTDIQIDRQTDRQTDRQMDMWIKRKGSSREIVNVVSGYCIASIKSIELKAMKTNQYNIVVLRNSKSAGNNFTLPSICLKIFPLA